MEVYGGGGTSYTQPLVVTFIEYGVVGVDISISPSEKEGAPGVTLTYEVTVKNTGDFTDNYLLENADNSGWILELDNRRLDNVAPGENRTTTLTVVIPENAELDAEDNINITVTSMENPGVSDSASCIARVTHWTGMASIRLATGSPPSPPFPWGIRKVRVNANLVVNLGDNLRLRFLAYDNKTVEWENVIWSRTAPGPENVILTDLIVPHDNTLPYPSGNVKRVKLVLTDSAGNLVLDNMAWYTAVQDDWGTRITWIILNWASHTAAERDQLGNEVTQIILNWAGTPTGRDRGDFWKP
jgi:hypothetical protein